MYRKLIFINFHICLSIYDFWVEEGEVFQIPAAKSIGVIFFKHSWWRAELCKVAYRKRRLLLLLGHGSFQYHREEEKHGNNSLHWLWSWSRPRLHSACLGCPLAFPNRKCSIKTRSDKNLPTYFSKNTLLTPLWSIPMLGLLCFPCPISWISDVNLLCLILYPVNLEKYCPQRKPKGQDM